VCLEYFCLQSPIVLHSQQKWIFMSSENFSILDLNQLERYNLMKSDLSGQDPITYHYTRKSIVKSLKLAMWRHPQNTTTRLVLPHVPTRQVGVRCWYCVKPYRSSLLFDTKTPITVYIPGFQHCTYPTLIQTLFS
jgi:hypothetical protein